MMTDKEKMTYEEMIDTIKGLVFGTFDRTTQKERDALDMAITILERKNESNSSSRYAKVL